MTRDNLNMATPVPKEEEVALPLPFLVLLLGAAGSQTRLSKL